MAMAFSRGAVFLLLSSVPTALSISLTDHVALNNPSSPLPASRIVDLKLFHVAEESDRRLFERTHHIPPNDNDAIEGASFVSLLRRRDGLTIYGKDIVHSKEEPNYAMLTMFQRHESECVPSPPCGAGSWDATLLLTPQKEEEATTTKKSSRSTCTTLHSDASSCFVAMNRFSVKEGCQHLFEQRWAERQSKLPQQEGFLSFCLLRRWPPNHNAVSARDQSHEMVESFNYSSLTIWTSFDSWTKWRNGDGRYSHDASRTLKRTPVKEWLDHPASPIFWDGIGTVIAETGI